MRYELSVLRRALGYRISIEALIELALRSRHDNGSDHVDGSER